VDSWQQGPVLHQEESIGHGPLAFSPDANVVAVSSDYSRQIKLVHIDTARELATLQAPDQASLHDLGYSPDGALLVGATTDHTLPVWDLEAVRHELSKVGLDRDLPQYPSTTRASEIGSSRLAIDVRY